MQPAANAGILDRTATAPTPDGAGAGVRSVENETEGYLKYGGVRFRANAPAEEINRFVRELPEARRASLREVARALADAGLITLEHDFSTLDDEVKPYLEGKPGPDDRPGAEPPDFSWR